MSINHRKVFNQIKDSISKITNDKSLQTILSKDILQVIQKLPSSVNKEIVKYFQQSASAAMPKKVLKNDLQNDASYTVPVVWSGPETKSDSKTAKPKWLRSKQLILKSTVINETEQIMQHIESAESDNSLLRHIDALLIHIKLHPEGRNSAIKTGAIRLLLRLRSRSHSDTIQASIRETLALLGYSDPVPGNGIRILAMDGGGIRGLLVLEMLKKLEELTGKQAHELFDLFCGVSTGAILSFSIGIHHTNLDEISAKYKEISMEVFKQSALWGTGNLVWSQAYYDTALWEKKLRDHLGTNSLISTARSAKCPKLCAVSAVVNQSRLSAYVFRNYSLPWRVKSQYFGCSHHEVWQAARASAAAPTYFEEFKLGNFLHQDGGILVNNPAAVAVHEAKLIWPNTPIQCVVSFGTGRSVPSPADLAKDMPLALNSTSWANKFYKILDSATDTEGVHIMLNDLLPSDVYYRFNPYLTEMISMVEINEKKIEQLERDAVMYLRRNEDKFQEAAFALTQPKSYLRKAKDYVNLQRELYGI